MKYLQFVLWSALVMVANLGVVRAECLPKSTAPLTTSERCTSRKIVTGNRPSQTRVCPTTPLLSATIGGFCYDGSDGAQTTIITAFCQATAGSGEPQNLDQIELTNKTFLCWEPVLRNGSTTAEGIIVYYNK